MTKETLEQLEAFQKSLLQIESGKENNLLNEIKQAQIVYKKLKIFNNKDILIRKFKKL